MRTVHSLLLAGIAAVALAGSVMAADKKSATHEFTVHLPWGGVAHIQYSGNVPPKVTFARDPGPLHVFLPDPFFAPDPAFAEIERISAEMDRQMREMIRQVETMSSPSFGRQGDLFEAATGDLPAGTQSYSVVSTITPNGICTREVQVTRSAGGGKPKVVKRSSGNCGGGSRNQSLDAPDSAPPARAI